MKWNIGRILIYISMIRHQRIDMCTIIYIYLSCVFLQINFKKYKNNLLQICTFLNNFILHGRERKKSEMSVRKHIKIIY